jgi:hypothetical protein
MDNRQSAIGNLKTSQPQSGSAGLEDLFWGRNSVPTFRCPPRLRLLKSFARGGYLAGEVVSGAPAT